MSSPTSQAVTPTDEKLEKLDEATERIITAFFNSPWREVSDRRNNLRIRIHELTEEARKLGQDQILHAYSLEAPVAEPPLTTLAALSRARKTAQPARCASMKEHPE